jgi:signal transduction histidine kinase
MNAQSASREHVMIAQAPQMPTAKRSDVVTRSSARHDWRCWLIPDVSTLFAMALYVATFLLLVTDGWPANNDYGQARSHPSEALAAAFATLALLALVDRVDLAIFGESSSVKVGVILLLARSGLIAAAFTATNVSYVLYLLGVLLPFFAARHLPARSTYVVAALVWILVAFVQNNIAYSWFSDPFVLTLFLVVYGLGLLGVAIDGILIANEVQSRRRAEELLASLERSHAELRDYSSEVLAATEERHQLAREIHARLRAALAVIGRDIDRALALRAAQPEQADAVTRVIKGKASEALHDVRLSVAALRATRAGFPDRLIVGGSGDQPIRPAKRSRLSVWLLPRAFDLVPTGMVLSFVGLSLAWSGPGPVLWQWLSVWIVLPMLGIIVVDRVEYALFGEATPRAARIAFLVLRLFLVIVYVEKTGWWDMPLFLLPLVPYFVAINFGKSPGLVALVACVLFTFAYSTVGWVTHFSSDTPRIWLITDLVITLLSALVFVATQMMLDERAHRRRAEGLLVDLRVAHRQLRVYAARAIAVNEERNHLAREIHDGLGHYLTVVNVQLEKAIAYRSVDPAVADQAMLDARGVVDAAIREMRGSLGALAPSLDRFDLPAALRQLAANLDGGMSIDVEVEGQPDGLAPQTLLVLFRVAQEALTNVQKHAKASAVRIALSCGATEATLQVDDDGCGFLLPSATAVPAKGTLGYGLRGIHERVGLVGGHLDLDSAPGHGTTIRVTVPKLATTAAS